ncbi:hypothetical protein DIPPA_20097 [Diplonema papillatum]|nr:hypothetical protein DIPPA_20097 [Diplonema papillatum]
MSAGNGTVPEDVEEDADLSPWFWVLLGLILCGACVILAVYCFRAQRRKLEADPKLEGDITTVRLDLTRRPEMDFESMDQYYARADANEALKADIARNRADAWSDANLASASSATLPVGVDVESQVPPPPMKPKPRDRIIACLLCRSPGDIMRSRRLKSGLKVTAVRFGGAAAAAGISTRHVILSVNGVPMKNEHDFDAQVNRRGQFPCRILALRSNTDPANVSSCVAALAVLAVSASATGDERARGRRSNVTFSPPEPEWAATTPAPGLSTPLLDRPSRESPEPGSPPTRPTFRAILPYGLLEAQEAESRSQIASAETDDRLTLATKAVHLASRELSPAPPTPQRSLPRRGVAGSKFSHPRTPPTLNPRSQQRGTPNSQSLSFPSPRDEHSPWGSPFRETEQHSDPGDNSDDDYVERVVYSPSRGVCTVPFLLLSVGVPPQPRTAVLSRSEFRVEQSSGEADVAIKLEHIDIARQSDDGLVAFELPTHNRDLAMQFTPKDAKTFMTALGAFFHKRTGLALAVKKLYPSSLFHNPLQSYLRLEAEPG